MEVGVLFRGTNTVQHTALREAECTMSALLQNRGMCTNALNCTHSSLIDGPELLRSTGQIPEWVKHGLSDRLNSLQFLFYTLSLSCKCTIGIQVKYPQPPHSSTQLS